MYSRRYLKETCSSAIIWKTENIFFEIFLAFSESSQKFVHFEKKDQLDSLNLSEIIDSEKCVYLNAQSSGFRTLFESQRLHEY